MALGRTAALEQGVLSKGSLGLLLEGNRQRIVSLELLVIFYLTGIPPSGLFTVNKLGLRELIKSIFDR